MCSSIRQYCPIYLYMRHDYAPRAELYTTASQLPKAGKVNRKLLARSPVSRNIHKEMESSSHHAKDTMYCLPQSIAPSRSLSDHNAIINVVDLAVVCCVRCVFDIETHSSDPRPSDYSSSKRKDAPDRESKEMNPRRSESGCASRFYLPCNIHALTRSIDSSQIHVRSCRQCSMR